jgi:hypothetical protein
VLRRCALVHQDREAFDVVIEILVQTPVSTSVRDQPEPEARQRLVVPTGRIDIGEASDLLGDDALGPLGSALTQNRPGEPDVLAVIEPGLADGPSSWCTPRFSRGVAPPI